MIIDGINRCGAPAKSTGVPCRRRVADSARCVHHGGDTDQRRRSRARDALVKSVVELDEIIDSSCSWWVEEIRPLIRALEESA